MLLSCDDLNRAAHR